MIKLKIQRFASTNQTTHYELSQYVANDKPTYLVDYNQDMTKIDTAIYGAESTATQASNNIGTMSNLNTTEKSSLVGAINEVKGEVDTNTSNISTNTSNISTLGANQGTMANLTTTDKTSLVGAINEVNAVNQTQNTNIGDLSNLSTNDKTSLVSAINENNYNIKNFNLSLFSTLTANDVTLTGSATKGYVDIGVATNSDKTLAKIYGEIYLSNVTGSGTAKFSTSLRPTQDLTINGSVFRYHMNTQGLVNSIRIISMTIKTDGTVEVPYTWASASGETVRFLFFNSLLFIKDFGDTPIPE